MVQSTTFPELLRGHFRGGSKLIRGVSEGHVEGVLDDFKGKASQQSTSCKPEAVQDMASTTA